MSADDERDAPDTAQDDERAGRRQWTATERVGAAMIGGWAVVGAAIAAHLAGLFG